MVAEDPKIAFTGDRVFRRRNFLIGLIKILVTGISSNHITDFIIVPADYVQIEIQIYRILKIGQLLRQFLFVPLQKTHRCDCRRERSALI